VGAIVTILKSSEHSILRGKCLGIVHSFCQAFCPYPAVQKLVNECSGGPHQTFSVLLDLCLKGMSIPF
jgi:hypothetical protein